MASLGQAASRSTRMQRYSLAGLLVVGVVLLAASKSGNAAPDLTYTSKVRLYETKHIPCVGAVICSILLFLCPPLRCCCGSRLFNSS
jgi:hypothetical protein